MPSNRTVLLKKVIYDQNLLHLFSSIKHKKFCPLLEISCYSGRTLCRFSRKLLRPLQLRYLAANRTTRVQPLKMVV